MTTPKTETRDVTELIEEIDALFEKAENKPWRSEDGDSVIRIHGVDDVCLAAVSTARYWKRFSDGDAANAALIIKLVNAWPVLRAALKSMGEENG